MTVRRMRAEQRDGIGCAFVAAGRVTRQRFPWPYCARMTNVGIMLTILGIFDHDPYSAPSAHRANQDTAPDAVHEVTSLCFRSRCTCDKRRKCLRHSAWGHVAEWLRNGLQNRVHQFNSGRGLHFNQLKLLVNFQHPVWPTQDRCRAIDASDGVLVHIWRLPTFRQVLAARSCDAVRNPRSHFAVPLWFSNAWFGETPWASKRLPALTFNTALTLSEPIFADEKRHLRVLHEIAAASIQSMPCTDYARGLGRDQQAAYQPSGNGTSGQGAPLSLAARGDG